MFKPRFYRKEEGSSGEKIVDMISSRLKRLSYNMNITTRGNEITIANQSTPLSMTDYFYPTNKRQEIKELIRAL